MGGLCAWSVYPVANCAACLDTVPRPTVSPGHIVHYVGRLLSPALDTAGRGRAMRMQLEGLLDSCHTPRRRLLHIVHMLGARSPQSLITAGRGWAMRMEYLSGGRLHCLLGDRATPHGIPCLHSTLCWAPAVPSIGYRWSWAGDAHVACWVAGLLPHPTASTVYI